MLQICRLAGKGTDRQSESETVNQLMRKKVNEYLTQPTSASPMRYSKSLIVIAWSSWPQPSLPYLHLFSSIFLSFLLYIQHV